MSIESNLSKIATALEQIASALQNPTVPAAPTAPDPVPEPPKTEAPPPPEMPKTEVPEPPVDVPGPTLGLDELNQCLVNVAGKLGGPDKIFELLKDQYGQSSLSKIDPAKYGEIKDKVEAMIDG